MPLWSDSIAEDHEGYDWKNYQAISTAEGLELAKAALRYYTWGVDYSMPTKGASKPVVGPAVYAANQAAIDQWAAIDAANTARPSGYFPGTVQSLDAATIPGASSLPAGWASALGADSPFTGGSAGSPMPFARGGVMSPREFARSMISQYSTARKPAYALSVSSAGVDGLGLVTGALAMTSLYSVVENLAATKPATNLDTYFRTGTKTADANRLTREDLEKCSLVVTDLRQMRAGDLVVHYGEGEGAVADPLKIAVVLYAPATGAPTHGADPTAYLSQVVVLGANEGDRQVTVGTWLDRFGDQARSVHVRRLLRTKVVAGMKRFDFKVGGVDQNLLEVMVADLTVSYAKSYEQTSPASGRETWRWIPNTGEYLVIEKIKVIAKNASGTEFDIGVKLGDHEVMIGAEDRDYDASKDELGNIYNNAGTGFEIAALPEEGWRNAPAATRIVDLTPHDHSAPNRMKYYHQNYSNSQFFATNGTLKDDSVIHLYRGTVTLGKDNLVTTRLGIRPLLGSIKPGDDILLRIGIRRAGTTTAAREASVGAKDYIAVYDKKLLWRANLYFDDGQDDWNNKHPWNAPLVGEDRVRNAKGEMKPVAEVLPWWSASWGYNEWNEPATGFRETYGGQITEIKSWSKWNGGSVSGHVAYGWGNWDSVAIFNSGLATQSVAIACQRATDKEYRKLSWTNGMTTAPANSWGNYVFPKRKKTLITDEKWDTQNGTLPGTYTYWFYEYGGLFSEEDISAPGLTQHEPASVNGSSASVPGLTTFLSFCTEDARNPTLDVGSPYLLRYNNRNYRWNQTSRSLGIDCSGLAHRSAKYYGSTYWAAASASKYGTNTFAGSINPNATLQIHPGRWKIDEAGDPDQLDHQRTISRAVPGDLIVKDGHVMIVQDLRYLKGSTVITDCTQVDLIHSTKGGRENSTWQVQHNTWGTPIGDDYATYQLRRYK